MKDSSFNKIKSDKQSGGAMVISTNIGKVTIINTTFDDVLAR